MRHVRDDELILYYYGERPGLRSSKAVGRHLGACAACREAYEALAAVLAAGAVWEPPPRDAAYGDHVWARVSSQLAAAGPGVDAEGARGWPPGGWPSWRHLVDGLLAPRCLTLVGYGATLGLLVTLLVPSASREAGAPPAPMPAHDEARERVLLTSLGDHFDRSQMMLLELANHEAESFDASGAQAWAQDLVATNRLYRQAAASEGETGFVTVLADLERVLLHVAHAPEVRPALLDTRRAEARDMLFKLRIAGDTVRARERAAFASLTYDE